MLQDVHHSFRLLGKAPGFTCLVVATLALGIGANTALFSVTNAVLWRPLPFERPDELAMVYIKLPKLVPASIPFSAADTIDFASDTRAFSKVAAIRTEYYDITGQGEPFRASGARVSPALFPLLGVNPTIGRTFTEDEDRTKQRLIVLGSPIARRLFGDPTTAIGKNLSLNRRLYTVIGVMPEHFRFPLRGIPYVGEAQFWVPMSYTQGELTQRGDTFNYVIIGRLAHGTPEQAIADTQRAFNIFRAKWSPEMPKDATISPEIVQVEKQVSSGVHNTVLLLLGAVGALLLIACTNVANLVLTRALGRRSEFNIRAALGASHGRVIRQLLTESVVLAVISGAVGIVIAAFGTEVIVRMAGNSLPRTEEISLDGRVLVFSLLLSLATGIFFGLIPALSLSKDGLADGLKEIGKGGASLGFRNRLRGALVISEVALSVVLLAGAGLLIRTLWNLQSTDPGFRAEQILRVPISLPATQYSAWNDTHAFHERLTSATSGLPGVSAIGIATTVPFGGRWTKSWTIEKFPTTGAAPRSAHTVIGEDYFNAMGIPLKLGRRFDTQDRTETEQSIIVNEAFVRTYLSGHDPLTIRIKNGIPENKEPWLRIIGVVGDTKLGSMDERPQPQTYSYWLQSSEAKNGAFRNVSYVFRADGNPQQLTSAIHGEIRRMDPQQVIGRIEVLRELIDESLSTHRFRMRLLSIFAATALLLAIIGIAGVIGVMVTQRFREFGLRMALGAKPTDILRHVLGGGLRLIVTGLFIGLAGSFTLSRTVSSFLYGVPTMDPWTYAAVFAVLVTTGLFAAYLPARRAANVDPLTALHHE